MKILFGEELEIYKREELRIQLSWNRRDFVGEAKNYLGTSLEKILAISGLSGTGKTVGILQAVSGYDVAYILVQNGETEDGSDYIEFLRNTDKKYIVIDEYSWIKERKQLDYYLLTAVQNGKRIIITARESIALEFLNYGRLCHKVQTIHTTLFTYDEYLRLNGLTRSKSNCIKYLTEGGLFSDYILRDIETTKEYINNAIVSNLAGYLRNEMSLEHVKALTYIILYKIISSLNFDEIPVVNGIHITLENFLEQMDVNTTLEIEEWNIQRVADIFEQAEIIVRIPNYDRESKLQELYFIVNPSLTYQLMKYIYNLKELPDSKFSRILESSIAAQLYTNKLANYEIYFHNGGFDKCNLYNKKLFFVITDKERKFVYSIECKIGTDPIFDKINIVSSNLENHSFQEIESWGADED